MSARPKSISILEKRIPVNPKYKAVTSVVDTGATVRRTPKVLSDQELAKRRSELFRRVRNPRIADLLRQLDPGEASESIYSYNAEEEGVDCSRSVIAPSVVSLGGQSLGLVSVVSSQAMGIANTRSFLILDLRSPEEYSKGRITHAVSHSGNLIARDMYHPAMMSFKVKRKGHYFLVYHADEKRSAHYATLLVEKGWEEVFIVEGGFDEFSTSYPELIETDPETTSGFLVNASLLNKPN